MTHLCPTPTQVRMARAALAMTLRAFGAAVGVSAMAISRYERGDTTVISVETLSRITDYCLAQRMYFGPKDGVCLGENVFATERWFGLACVQLLEDHGVHPTSLELLAAYERCTQGVTP